MYAKLRQALGREMVLGREKYAEAAVLVTLCEIGGEAHVILEKRPRHLRQGGDVSLPGGRREAGDASWEETAVRETVEELGVDRERISVLGKLGTLITPSGALIEAYVGQLRLEAGEWLDYDRREVEYLIPIPLRFFLETPPEVYELTVETKPYLERDGERVEFPSVALNLPEMYHQPWQGKPRKVYLYRYEGEVIWGIAGEIVYRTAETVRQVLDDEGVSGRGGADTQLQMVWPSPLFDAPPAVEIPPGYCLRTYQRGDEPRFYTLMELAGWPGWDEERLRPWLARIPPGSWTMAVHEASGEIAATAMGLHDHSEAHPFGGELGWVAADPDHRGRGLGMAVSAAVTARLIEAGYRDIHLYTEDHRLPALKTYLKLGYLPLLYAPDMAERWRAVCGLLGWPYTPEEWPSHP